MRHLFQKYKLVNIHHIFAALRLLVLLIGLLYCYLNRQSCILTVYAILGAFFLVYSIPVIYFSLRKSKWRNAVYTISGYLDISVMMALLYWDPGLQLNIYFAAYLLVVMHSLYFGIRYAVVLLSYATLLYLVILGPLILEQNLFDFFVRMASGITLSLMVGLLAEQMKKKTKTIISLNKTLLKEIRKKEELLHELREKKSTLASLYSLSQLLSSINSTRDIFQQVIDFVSGKMPEMKFSILIKGSEQWHLAATSSNTPTKEKTDMSCFGISLAGAMAEQGNTIFLNNQKITQPRQCWLNVNDESHECTSQCSFALDQDSFDIHDSNKLIIPIMVAGSVFGAFIIITPGPKDLSGSEIDFFKSLTHQMGMAIEKAQAFKKLKKSSETDALTGIYNRKKLLEIGAQQLQQAQDSGQSLGCIFLDLDHFKIINDTHGHQAGDQVLRAIAGVMHESIRQDDTFGRYGGEEFVILLPSTDKESTLQVAEKIRSKTKQMTIDLPEDKSLKLTISCGIAVFPEDDENLEKILDKADRALYRAKQLGRNRAEPYIAKLDRHPVPDSTELSSDNKQQGWFDDIFRFISQPFDQKNHNQKNHEHKNPNDTKDR